MAAFQLMCCNNMHTGFIFKNSQRLNNCSVLASSVVGDMSWRASLTWDVLESREGQRCCGLLFPINFVDSEEARLCPQVTSRGTIKSRISVSLLISLIFRKVLHKTTCIYNLLWFLPGFINNVFPTRSPDFGEMWDLPLEYLRLDSSLVPGQVLEQLLSLLHFKGCHLCLRNDKAIPFPSAMPGLCCHSLPWANQQLLWGDTFLPYCTKYFLRKSLPPLLHFPGCTGTTGLKLYWKLESFKNIWEES